MRLKPLLHTVMGIAALGVAACSSTPEPETTGAIPIEQTIDGALSGDQISSLIGGNTGFGQESRYQWRTYFLSDGTMAGRHWGDFGEERDRGVWEVTDKHHFCREWSLKWGERKRACFEVYKDGEQIKLINVDGNGESFEMMLVSGDKLES